MKIFVCFVIVLVLVAAEELKLNLEARDNGFLFEGDMVLTKESISAAVNGNVAPDADKLYSVLRSLNLRWKNGIVPYVMDKSVKNKVLNAVGVKGPTEKSIRDAMNAWEKKTCIRFIERTNQVDYILFVDEGFGKCWSHVGRTGGRQKISLGFGCFTTGIAIHEIGHALGFYHEQSRPDRDDYIEILWDNIKKDKKHNFKKYDRGLIHSRGSPYDYDSIMHYQWNAFSKIPLVQRTIRAKKSGVKFGQRSHISVQDAHQMNLYYNCKMPY